MKTSPFVGEIIAFFPGDNEVIVKEEGVHLAAIVTYVHTHEKINCVVYDYSGQPKPLSSIPFFLNKPVNHIPQSHARPLNYDQA